LKPVQFLFGNTIPGFTMMFNKELRDLVIQATPKNIVLHDSWTAAVAAFMGRIDYLNYTGAFYRQHSSNDVGYAISFSDNFKRLPKAKLFAKSWRLQAEQLTKVASQSGIQIDSLVATVIEILNCHFLARLSQFSKIPGHPKGYYATLVRRIFYILGYYTRI